jgi:hypothetical protein
MSAANPPAKTIEWTTTSPITGLAKPRGARRNFMVGDYQSKGDTDSQALSSLRNALLPAADIICG